MGNKEAYLGFSLDEPIPIFSQPWWLNATVKDIWDVVLVEDKGGNIIGSMPYLINKKYGVVSSYMPVLTQKLGPYIKYPEGIKYDSKISHEKKVMTQLCRWQKVQSKLQ